MLTYIRDEVKPDILIWTGDTVPHDLWGMSTESVINDVTKVSNIISNILGNTTVIYPSVGNHDAYPVNNYDFSKAQGNT